MIMIKHIIHIDSIMKIKTLNKCHYQYNEIEKLYSDIKASKSYMFD